MKDFTSILTMHRDARGEIFSQLREIYDGQYSKAWGTGKEVNWHGKVGILAGVTGIIDRENAFNSALGERFLMYRIPPVSPREQSRRALAQQTMNEVGRKLRLQHAVRDYLCEPALAKPDVREIPAAMENGFHAL